jgi:hypothetical protein
VRRGYSRGLVAHTPPKNPAEGHTANPLKLACRQLRDETLVLSLKLNTMYFHEPADGTGWLYTVCDYIQNLAERYPGCVGQVVVETNHRNQDKNATSVSMVEWLKTWASFCADFPNCSVLVRFQWKAINGSPRA